MYMLQFTYIDVNVLLFDVHISIYYSFIITIINIFYFAGKEKQLQ